jgi:hypothetical protein
MTPTPTPTASPTASPTATATATATAAPTPESPTGFMVISDPVANETNILTWEENPPIQGVNSYKVERQKGNSDSYEVIAQPNTPPFNATNYLKGKKTNFRIKAVSPNGDSLPTGSQTIQQ